MRDGTVAERTPAVIRSIPWSVISIVVMAAALVVLIATYRPPADTAEEIGSLIRCPVCQGVPISESPAPMARDMMEILRRELAEGASRQEAIDAVLGAYPGSLLLEPPVSASTLALWGVPLGALVVGLGLALTLRRSRLDTSTLLEEAEARQRLEQIRADLEELAAQQASGEIDAEAARHLREGYEAELAETHAALRQLASAPDAPLPRSTTRAVAGAALVVGALVVVVLVAGAFIVDRPDQSSGVADVAADPSSVSNETLAAVIAANEDHPQIDGMRLALAERYYEEGDFQSSFPYYFDVASSDKATPAQAATALTRLGWMAYSGNGEVDTALDLLAQARELVPDDPFPLYLEGLVRWCGRGDASAGAEAFRQVLSHDLGDETVRQQVEADLAAAEAGETCER
ncbi:MAG TPA: cytochrome c-type biogenesis protein [Acidimicrobiia bacterium]|jgi:cytochrome c-type biogenesis protein CcmH